MRISWMLAALILGLTACGNPSDFRVKVMPLERVEPAQPDSGKPSGMESGQIVRLSRKIQYQNLQANWQDEKVILKGNFKLNNLDLGALEMQGERNGEEIIFSATREDLSQKVKAKATCISDDGVCSDFFIDIFVKEDSGKISHDQFVLKDQTLIPLPPSTPGSTTTTLSKSKPAIDDEVEDVKLGAYVGISDEEALALFKPVTDIPAGPRPTVPHIPEDATTSPSSTTTTSTTTTFVTTTTLLNSNTPVEQAVGAPNKGRLQNAVDLSKTATEAQGSFSLVWPTRTVHFATDSMANLIKDIASFVYEKNSGYVFKVGDVSNQNGNYVSPHASHQNGLDADLGYLVSNARSDFRSVITSQNVNSDFMATGNWELFKKIYQSGKVELIFVHGFIKKALCAEAIRSGDLKNAKDRGAAYELLRRVKEEASHDNHFHLRISCPKTDKRCRQPVYTLQDSGCF